MTIDRFAGDYFFLSNFYPSYIEYKGYFYKTVEHAYQAAKAVNEKDRIRIRDAATPGKAKRLGRKVDMVANWDNIKVSIMRTLIDIKFSVGSPLAKRLIDTHGELVEGNTWGDTFWGTVDGEGENQLGRALMSTRMWRDIDDIQGDKI